ncbi:MAG: 23S rRNA (pseudouridine(1915)-N(3))-methyltransferase RlmH [Betaproteobacteria bacterium]|nr:23S rRNA (pseudouridine(1915)-N(3))-methyltransferase RlmH [Betaproteobacteria bacterium]
MKLLIAAVGQRMPRWVDEAFFEYAKRMPKRARIELVEIRPEPRAPGRALAKILQAEGERIAAALPPGCAVIALDERGRTLSSAEFARWLSRRLDAGADAAFVVGGADGLWPALKERAEMLLSLSAMTLPHALARVLLAEQLYRAAAILQGHPYHRG